MLRTYFKTALRNLIRQKTVTLINIFCMAIAISCSIIAYLFATDNVNSEWFHERASNIFVIEHQAIEEGDLATFGNTPTPLASSMLSDHSFITRTTRVMFDIGTAMADGKEFEELIQYADPSFLEMFTFPLAYGDPKSLHNKNSVILSHQAAIRFFGAENAIGKTIEFTLAKDKVLFTVSGVAKEFIGPSSCVRFSLLTNYENMFRSNPAEANDWNSFTAATFIEVDDPKSIAKLTTSMQPYVKLQNAADKTNMLIKSFSFRNLNEISSSNGVRNSIAGEMAMAPIIVLSAIAIFLLLLACFNSINISLASVGMRLKEIGIRKVIGGNKSQLVVQFLTENVLISLASLLIAVALTGSLLLPAFEEIAGTGLTMDFGTRIDLWVYLLAMFFLVGLCSGLYPAFYISSFQPIAILRDKLQFGGKNKFMRSLLTLQFVIAFITIITSVSLTMNHAELRKRDWGYRKENLLTLRVETPEQYNLRAKIASEQPNISKVTGAKKHVGSFNSNSVAYAGEAKTNTIVFEVASDYFETMGFHTVAGKFPQAADAVVVNENFVRQFGWANPVGEIITIDSNKYSIAAVVKDFHHDNFMREISSVVLKLEKEEALTTLIMRIDPGTGTRTQSTLETAWKKNFPDAPINLTYQEETFGGMYRESAGILRIFTFTTVVALFMSCMGLFGLAAQRVQAKQKEICIRKIFGVSVLRAVLLVNGNFLILLAVAAIVASPLSYLMLNELLDSIYIYRMDVTSAPFVFSYILMGVTILITLSGKIRQIAKANPANILRRE
jgi:putative ABC transport system permease protein